MRWKKTQSAAIEVPPGRYRITRLLEIVRPNVVLRGAGPDKTILFFPTPLNDIKPNWGATTTGQRTSNYSWSGGFITVRGNLGSKKLAEISNPRNSVPSAEEDSTTRLLRNSGNSFFNQRKRSNESSHRPPLESESIGVETAGESYAQQKLKVALFVD